MAKTKQVKEEEPYKPIVRPPTLWGSCLDAKLIKRSKRPTNGTLEQVHHRCKGHTVSPRGDYGPCGCACHQNGNPPRCLNCGAADTELSINPGPWAGRCIDVEGCNERLQIKLANDPNWQKWKETERIAAERNAANRQAQAENSERAERPTRPTSGRCEHCGAPTKGGKFVAGHDAKLKGLLMREANGTPDDGWTNHPADAALELILRGWPTKSCADEGLMRQAQARYDSTTGVELAAWLSQRVQARIG